MGKLVLRWSLTFKLSATCLLKEVMIAIEFFDIRESALRNCPGPTTFARFSVQNCDTLMGGISRSNRVVCIVST